MEEPKATPQDLTLLDELEKNIETVIGILDDDISKIDLWNKKLEQTSETGLSALLKSAIDTAFAIIKSFSPFGDRLPEIQLSLTTYAPQYKGDVDKAYSDIKKKSEEIVARSSYGAFDPPPLPPPPACQMAEFKNCIEKMIRLLRCCVKVAKEGITINKSVPQATVEATPGADPKDDEAPVIEIDTSKFNDSPSKKLIENLATSPSGVKKNEGLYGKHQPRNLKAVLKGTKYDEVRQHICERKGTIYLDGILLKIKK